MDVYANDYVTAAIDFMTASASKAEIERFGLMAGDVVITKDSETPDDIGVSAVIAEQISGLVCGYHLALIRPRNGEIDPIYLAKQLRSSPSIKYFAANASGSTRFGLSISAIENLEIPLAPRPEQTKIGEILATVDRAIEQTEALIAKQQRIKTGLMQDPPHPRHRRTRQPPLRTNPRVQRLAAGANSGGVGSRRIRRLCCRRCWNQAGSIWIESTKDMYSDVGYRVYGQEQVIGEITSILGITTYRNASSQKWRTLRSDKATFLSVLWEQSVTF